LAYPLTYEPSLGPEYGPTLFLFWRGDLMADLGWMRVQRWLARKNRRLLGLKPGHIPEESGPIAGRFPVADEFPADKFALKANLFLCPGDVAGFAN